MDNPDEEYEKVEKEDIFDELEAWERLNHIHPEDVKRIQNLSLLIWFV